MGYKKILSKQLLNSKKKYYFIFVIAAIFIVVSSVYGINHYLNYQKQQKVIKDAIAIIESCKNHKSKEVCLATQFGVFTKTHTLKDVLMTFHAAEQLDPQVRFCHLTAHKISIAEVEKNPENWLQLFNQVDPVACSRGFFHGILEGHMQTNPDFVLNEKTMPKICTDVTSSIKNNYQVKEYRNNCIHSLAHILLVQESANVQSAIDMCKKITESEDQTQCYYGVFMEDKQRQNLQQHGYGSASQNGFKKIEDYINECNGYTDTLHETCWLSLAWTMYQLKGESIKQTFEACNQATTAKASVNCFTRSVGIKIGVEASNNKNMSTQDYCVYYLSKPDQYDACVKKIAAFMTELSFEFEPIAKQFCSKVKSDKQEMCRTHLSQTKQSLSKETEDTSSTGDLINELFIATDPEP